MIHVGICIDNNYVRYLMPVIRSIRACTISEATFHVLCDKNISNQDVLKIEREGLIVYPDIEIDLPVNRSDGFVSSRAMFYRLLLPEILPDIGKCIYVECDSIFLSDIQDLWDIDIGESYIAACKDMFGQDLYKSQIHQGALKDQNRDLTKPSYMTGLLIMNLNEWRKNNLREKIEKIIRENCVRDMLAINLACAGKIYEIDKAYCYPGSRDVTKIAVLSHYIDTVPKVIHWNGKHKGWAGNTPQQKYWSKYE